MDLALNNLQRLICHKTKQTKPTQSFGIKAIVIMNEICELRSIAEQDFLLFNI